MEETKDQRCGLCTYWAHSHKRNCSSPATPAYYAECLYPIDHSAMPDCIETSEMHEGHGTKCPCFAPSRCEE